LAAGADDSLRHRARAARADLIRGALPAEALLELLLSVPYVERDAWADELLGLEQAPPDIPDLPRGSVPYLPSGVDEILTMVREVPIRQSDAFVDLGSGLGRVVMLTHLLSGARGVGVEIQEPLVCAARRGAAALALGGVSFVRANAADLDLDGSVFFLYAPFNGKMLTHVLGRLESVARRRPIVVCTVGMEFRDVRWLAPRTTSSVSLSVYDSSLHR
jgi:hypothetical protein